MNLQDQHLKSILEDPSAGASWLQELGVQDAARGQTNLANIAGLNLPLDLMSVICSQLFDYLPISSDPDRALNNLERFVVSARNPLSLASLFERDTESLPQLLQIFATSQYLSDVLVSDPESYDLLRLTGGQPSARQALVDEITSEVRVLSEPAAVAATLRRFKRRETLRIAYGDIIAQQRLDTVTRQISYLADALVEAGLQTAWSRLAEKHGEPLDAEGQRARLVVLAMGKLGGSELNYSSDIDLICLYDHDGKTAGPRALSNAEFFAAVIRDTVKLLTEATDLGTVYRVDLRLRPEGSRGPVAMSIDSALNYYDIRGRTWERQAMMKARPAAGDLELGREFLDRLTPWIFRKYLGLADITGIKALKRRIEQRTQREGGDELDVKTGHGGIRDIEFAIQFLQLLHGSDLPEVRTSNTLEAMSRLEHVGSLTHQEWTLLDENYRFLRKVEHRLQIMFDLQTHTMPESDEEIQKLAIRMGYTDTADHSAAATFRQDHRHKTQQNRKVLDHLLHEAFGEDAPAEPEVDLVLDPEPPESRVDEVLGKYGFEDIPGAYRNLMDLSEEKIRFLSTRRCRMFLAAIAPQLLRAIAARPDPDATLLNLCKVSDSLGGKGVLWELFSANDPSLQLYVELCASSPMLSNVLISNPGMIDELMDSLVLDRLPKIASMQQQIVELCYGAEDPEPILHSFKSSMQLRVGVRDILGKEDIQATTGALSDVAQACLRLITEMEYQKLALRLGEPIVALGPRAGHVCEFVILAMGKFGGRELNYHSDLDLVFLFEAEGGTQHRKSGRSGEVTSNQHFFDELAQRIIKLAGRLGPYGRLYEIDPRLRPTGRSGALATSMPEFARYFAEGDGQLWERMALCRARPVLGNERAQYRVNQAVATAAFDHDWQSDFAQEILNMRGRLEEAASVGSLKRGRGGIVDIEFIAQLLQLREGRERPELRQPNTVMALGALREAGCLDAEAHDYLARSYRFLRTVESRVQLMNPLAASSLPTDRAEQRKLARLCGLASPEALLAECESLAEGNRGYFERFTSEAAG